MTPASQTTSTATTTTTSDCCQFRPHYLRPDTCRSCSAEMSAHNVANKTESGGGTGGSECKQCAGKQLEINRLKTELVEWQQRCRLAEEQSRQTRDELQSLEGEMEELHDNFKEEENEQFEQVKQELDACLKNCKILQIRLNKSERQYNQLEQVKQMLERQLQEQRLAIADNDRNETNCDNQTKDVIDGWLRRQQSDKAAPFELELASPNEAGQLQGAEIEFVKLTASEYDQMLRDLNDTSERERDLQEQIKYSQEEAQLKGERLQAIEAENEILMGRINKLTLANSSLRSSTMLSGNQHEQQRPTIGTIKETAAPTETGSTCSNASETERAQKLRELCEQNEQLKLALELAQSEAERMRARIQESQRLIEAKEQALQEAESRVQRVTSEQNPAHDQQQVQRPSTRPELECRQLRARLVHSERECRQLRSQLECLNQSDTSSVGRRLAVGSSFRSHSLESPSSQSEQHSSCTSAKCRELERQLERQNKSLLERNNQLEVKLQKLVEMSSESFEKRTSMESELIDKLKRQLDTSESELAKAKSRLVELDIECGRAQRQYKRLMSSLESCGSQGGEFQLLRRNKLPSEQTRDSLSRQELRQAIRDLELDLDDLMTIIRAKECFIREQASQSGQQLYETQGAEGTQLAERSNLQQQQQTSEQQVKSLRRLLEQERLLSNNLKLDVANLEHDNQELKGCRLILERERVAMEEELDKMRQTLGEQRAEMEEIEGEKQRVQSKNRELNETLERLKLELDQATRRPESANKSDNERAESPAGSKQRELLLMARDLSELKVKNGFLMRQLEMSREDAARQQDELKSAYEAQQRRAIELAQIELKERHLQENQLVRDELTDLKQKLAQMARQTARQEEENNLERERARAMERDWRRDKSQWQQARDQLEGQLAIEKRSSELKLKEVEATIRDKERNLISVQDRCVQLERDLKRIQNKYHLLEEDNESKIKQLTRDLELRTKDLTEATRHRRSQEELQYETMRRLNEEKSTLKETLETIKRSYDEKLVEAKQLRELLKSRQEQTYKERAQLLERVDALSRRINELTEQETQARLVRQRLEIQERQLESVRRELANVKEERAKLRDHCDELEKRELITKTSSISGCLPASSHHSGSSSFLRPFSSKSQLVGRPSSESSKPSGTLSPVNRNPAHQTTMGNETQQSELIVERLSGKINDQRNLINILRQQFNETQMELKQMKLLQASEKSKWQTQISLLTSRLNECEEKLAFETLLLQANPLTIDQLARPRLDSNWQLERQANVDLIKQQQSQIELLTRDLKKLSQAHDLLRHHSRQLEGHNNKLSKRLIELQQQSNFSTQFDRRLHSDYEQIAEQHARQSQELKPLLVIVSKIINSLDAPEQQQQQVVKSNAMQSPGSDSTERPLRAGATPSPTSIARASSDESDLEPNVTTPKPAHQINKIAQTQGRLTRLLAGGKLQRELNSSVSPPELASATKSTTAKPVAGKTTRRVRVKCSTLGITTVEKKQLKQQLKLLSDSLETGDNILQSDRERLPSTKVGSAQPSAQATKSISVESRPHSTSSAQGKLTEELACNTTATNTDQSSQRSQWSRIRWQLDSDLESERSWSLEPMSDNGRNDVYRRFPQATPATSGRRHHSSGGASLTDYESESSLAASDYSLSGYGLATHNRRAGANPSGAESDSGLTAGSKVSSGRKKATGLKGRLTNTLRNISRSITGLGSDTEDQTNETTSNRTRRATSSSSTRSRRDNDQTSGANKSILREIRV